uniref:Secreted protein n=1 Tax=Anopheles stephensi TaxID=30069 RepID=A0A182YB81_ANOST
MRLIATVQLISTTASTENVCHETSTAPFGSRSDPARRSPHQDERRHRYPREGPIEGARRDGGSRRSRCSQHTNRRACAVGGEGRRKGAAAGVRRHQGGAGRQQRVSPVPGSRYSGQNRISTVQQDTISEVCVCVCVCNRTNAIPWQQQIKVRWRHLLSTLRSESVKRPERQFPVLFERECFQHR